MFVVINNEQEYVFVRELLMENAFISLYIMNKMSSFSCPNIGVSLSKIK